MPKTLECSGPILISVLFTITFGLAGIGKIFSSQTPEWFITQFQNTILDPFPGALSLTYYGLGAIETVVGAFFAISLLPKFAWLQTSALTGALAIFVALNFGQHITHHYEEAGILFLSALATYLVLRTPRQVT